MHLDKLIGSNTYRGIVRSYVDEPNADHSDWENEELLDYVNMEHRYLFTCIRNLYEDWFTRTWVFPLVSDQYKYYMPREIVNPRRIELLGSPGVSGSSPNYVVDEVISDPQELKEVPLSSKDNNQYYTSNNRVLGTSGYYLLDDTLNFLPDLKVSSQYYCRIYYSPTAMDLHRAVAQGGTSSTIIFGINMTPSSSATTLGTVSNVENYYQGAYVEIISGTGIGQIRRINYYAGTTSTATVEPAWTTTPDTTSVYSIVSPIKEDFQEMLALGAVIRAKGIKIEDPAEVVAQMYIQLKDEMVNSLETRNNSSPRRVKQTQRSGVWY